MFGPFVINPVPPPLLFTRVNLYPFALHSLSVSLSGQMARFAKSSFVSGEARLVVRKCVPEDAGAYTCVAENAAGKTSSSSAVYVRGNTHAHTQRRRRRQLLGLYKEDVVLQ